MKETSLLYSTRRLHVPSGWGLGQGWGEAIVSSMLAQIVEKLDKLEQKIDRMEAKVDRPAAS